MRRNACDKTSRFCYLQFLWQLNFQELFPYGCRFWAPQMLKFGRGICFQSINVLWLQIRLQNFRRSQKYVCSRLFLKQALKIRSDTSVSGSMPELLFIQQAELQKVRVKYQKQHTSNTLYPSINDGFSLMASSFGWKEGETKWSLYRILAVPSAAFSNTKYWGAA